MRRMPHMMRPSRLSSTLHEFLRAAPVSRMFLPLRDTALMAERIAILIFDAFSLVEVSSVAEVFRLADEIELEREVAAREHVSAPSSSSSSPSSLSSAAASAGESDVREPEPLHRLHESHSANGLHAPYELIVVSDVGGSIASSGAMRVWSERLEDYASIGFDVLFIAGGPGAGRVKTDETLLRHLHAVLAKTRLVKAIGEGFAILAAAHALGGHAQPGTAPNAPLLSGATTAPRTAPLIEQPVALDDPLGPIAAALSIVKRERGADTAREISERSIPGAWRRLGAVLGELDEGGAREKINAAARWMRENYGQPVSVAKAAQVAAMSERSFLRRFKSQMGLTPSEYLLRARLDASCLLLVATDLPVDKIARRCGVSSGDGLAKIFRKRLAISPTEYRTTERRRSVRG